MNKHFRRGGVWVVAAAALLLSAIAGPITAQDTDGQHPAEALNLCIQMQCLFLPVEVDYYMQGGDSAESHVFMAFFGKEFPTDLASFYYRKADATMWAQTTSGNWRLLGPPLGARMIAHIPYATTVRLGRTANGDLLQARDYPLRNEASPQAATASDDGAWGAALLGLGALWMWSKASEAQDAAEQEDCMKRCTLERGRCVELCTVEK